MRIPLMSGLALACLSGATLAGAAMFGAATAAFADPAPTAPAAEPQAQTNAQRFEGRPEARISFPSSIRGFRVEREDGDDILYVEGPGRTWYRGELVCFGLRDPDFAYGMVPITNGGSFDRFSRVVFTGIGGHDRTQCRLHSLIQLTQAEAVELGLRRAPRDAATPAGGTPASAPSTNPG